MRIPSLAALALLLSGCASSGPLIENTRLDGLQKGKTTINEVVHRFGRPSFHSDNMDGSKTSAYIQPGNRSDAAALVSLVAALASNTATSVHSIIFRFDANGVLTAYERTGDSPAANLSARSGAAGDAPPAAALTPAKTAPARPAREDKLPGWMPSSSSRDPRDPY